ncbi:MAG: MBL fold metallo-hydrolase [Candidatus Omnitrophica bacterium]|nr:MBL fold metallo-hydrolase [Candidatus Omnitrophota bacterium]
MAIEKVVVGDFQTNCYIVTCKKTGESFVIDPGDEYGRIKSFIRGREKQPYFIVNTHGHADHIKDDGEFRLPVYIHRQDADCFRNPEKNLSAFFGTPLVLDIKPVLLEDGDTVKVGEVVFEVMHTPGHSPGSISLRSGGIVFTGDTLFNCGYGRTDFPGGDEEKLFDSIRTRLFVLPEETVIYPGHGPSSTIGAEKQYF